MGSLITVLFCRHLSETTIQKVIVGHETQRVQLKTQLSLSQQRNAELLTDLSRRERRIDELIAEQGQEIARRAVLETQAARTVELEESLAEIETKLEESYRQLSGFAASEAKLAEALEREKKSAAEKLQLLNGAQQQLAETFNALSAAALNQNNQSFLDLANLTLERFQATASADLEYRQLTVFEQMRPVQESLAKVESRIQEMEAARAVAFLGLEHQIRSLAESERLLRTEASNLAQALRSSGTRGRWGEIQLRRVVELAGMQKHCDFAEQVSPASESGRLRPDLLIKLPADRLIVVDAKAPITAYWEASDAPDEATRRLKLKEHAAAIRNHINTLSKKSYWDLFSPPPEFVFLFLPGECFYSAALEHDDSLIEYGVEHGVVLATPTTLIALLKAVAYGWRQESMAENAKQISALGRELYERLAKMTDHLSRLGKSLGNTVDAYNSTIGSLERRVLVTARKFKDLDAVPENAEIGEIVPLDHLPRVLQAAELELLNAADGIADSLPK
ncbi:MAG TPA: DNA recombination protein RmuC [Blastocatellia bacterium]|nr:DNA recombination protein RmuC [Blastocatellia bacterium]